MAKLKDTNIEGNLSVSGNIIPWGGAQTAYAYIGSREMNYTHGTAAVGDSVGSKSYSVNVSANTDTWFPVLIGCAYGNVFSVVWDVDARTLAFNVINVSSGTHSISTQWRIHCFRKL